MNDLLSKEERAWLGRYFDRLLLAVAIAVPVVVVLLALTFPA